MNKNIKGRVSICRPRAADAYALLTGAWEYAARRTSDNKNKVSACRTYGARCVLWLSFFVIFRYCTQAFL